MNPFAAMLWLLLSARAAPSPTPIVAQAETMLNQGDVDSALNTLREHVNAHPGDVEAQELFIDILNGIGQSEMVTRAYTAAAQAAPDSADTWYLAGRASPDVQTALQAYQHALAIDGGHARAWMGIGALRRVRGDPAGAVVAYQNALAADRTLTEAWGGLIRSLDAAGQHDAALRTAQEGVKLHPETADLWLALAALDPAHRLETLRKATRKLPQNVDLHLITARELFQQRDWAQAANAYRATLALQPDLTDARVELALINELRAGVLSGGGAQAILDMRGSSQLDHTSISLLDGVVSDNPDSGWARLVRGNVFAALASRESDPTQRSTLLTHAEADLRAAMDRMPGSPQGWAALGRFLLSVKRSTEAAPLLLKASTELSGDVTLAVAAAMAQAQSGDLKSAKTTLIAASQRFPNSDGPALALARVLISSGDKAGAYDVLLQTARRRPTRNIVLALTSTAQATGQLQDAATALQATADRTGDPRFDQAADTLRAAIPPHQP